MHKWKSRVVFVSIAGLLSAASVAFGRMSMVDRVQRAVVKNSDAALGAPVEWQLIFQYPFSPLASDLFQFHNYLLGISIALCALVLTLLLFAVWRWRMSDNPYQSQVRN
jgi:heme/copper-type cytochrome/quinol oxidase subunit 2